MATNDNAITEYIKRVGKSITYAASELLREQMPVTTSFISTGSEAVKEIVQDMPGVKEISEKVTQLQDEYIFKPANKLVEHLKEDIRTGNFYHPERQEESDLDMIKNLLGEDVGAMLNGDFDFDEEGGDEDIPVKGIPTITRGESIVANSVLTSARKSTNAISNTIARFGQANMKSTKAIASMQYAQGERQNLLLNQGFSNLAGGMNAIIEFNNKVLLTHTENSKLFYDSMTKMTQENNAILKEMIEISRGTYKQSQEGEGEEGTEKIGQIFKNGIIDLKEYFKQIQVNANNTMIGTIMQMLPMVPMMIKDIVDNPMNFVSKQVMSTLLGPQLKLAMRNFDRTLGGFMQTMLGRLYDYGQANPDSILGQIARVFGHKEKNSPFRSADTSKYNKGPMAWNGIANRTLVEVIPGYLARIEAALTNAGERYFDAQQGKWISANQATKKEKAMDHRAERNATRAFKDTMRKEFAITYPLDKLVDAKTPEEAKKQYEAAKKMYAEFNKRLDDLASDIFRKGGVFNFQGMLEELQTQYEQGDIVARQIQDALIKTKNLDPRILPEMTRDVQQYYSDKRQMLDNMDFTKADNIVNMIASGGMKGALFRDTSLPTGKYDSHRGVLKGLNAGLGGLSPNIKDDRGMSIYDYQYKIYRELYTIRKYGLFATINGENNDKIIQSIDRNIRPGDEGTTSPTGSPPNKPIEPTDGLRIGTNDNGETTYNGFTEEELNNFDTNKPARGKKYAKQRRKVLATRRLIENQRKKQREEYERQQTSSNRIIQSRPVNFVEEEEEFWTNPEELNKKKQKEARSKKIVSMYTNDDTWRPRVANERAYWENVHEVKLSAQEDFDPIRFNEDPEYRRRVLRQGDKKNEQIKADQKKQALDVEKSILESAIDLISGEDKQKYPKGVNPNAPFLEQLTQAAGIGAKMKVISNNINNLTRAPSAILSSVLTHADNFMFELMYGKDTELKDKRGKEIKGIFNLMIYKTEEATDKLNNYIDDLFTDTIAKFKESTLGQFSDIAKDWFGIDLESFMTQGRDYVKGFTRVIGDSTKDIVKSGVRDVQKSVSDILPDTSSLKMANEISGGSIFESVPFIKRIVEETDKIREGRAQADAEEAKEQAEKAKKEQQKKDDKKQEPQTHASGARQITKGGLTFISPGEAIIPANMNPWNPNRNNVDINLQQAQENRMKQKYMDSLPNSIQKARAKNIPTNAKGNGFFSGFSVDDIAMALQALGMGMTSKNNAMGNILGFLNELGITSRELAGIGGGEFSKIGRKLNSFLSDKNQQRVGRISNDLVELIINSGLLEKLSDEQVDNFYAFVTNAGYKGPIVTKDDLRKREMANKDMEDPSMLNSINIFTQNAFGTDLNKAAKVTGDVITKNFPELASGGIVGALASTIFPLGGPLFGAVAGAALNTLSHNKTFNEFVFGKWIVDNPETGQGHLEEGLLPQSWVNAIDKYLPDIKGFGIGGTVAGLFTPFGPLGGAMIGAGLGILKNNEAVKKFLFGEDTGLINKDRQAAIKRAFPNISAASMGMMLLDPFGIGLLSSAVLGSGLGLLSTTDGFKNAILGTPGRDGIRRGGLAEALKWQVTEPFKMMMKDMRDNLGKWFRRKFLEPMGRAFTGVGRMLAGTLKEASIWAFDKLANKLHGTFVDKFFNRAFKAGRKILSIPLNLFKGVGKVAGGIFSGIGNTLGEFAESNNLKNNRYKDKTAEERLAIANKIGANYDSKGIDEYLSALSNPEAQEFARMVQTVALIKGKGPNSVRNAFIKEQNQEIAKFRGDALKLNQKQYEQGKIKRDTYDKVLNIVGEINDLTKSGKYGRLSSYIERLKEDSSLPTEYRQQLLEYITPFYNRFRELENNKNNLQNSKIVEDYEAKIKELTGVSIEDLGGYQKSRLAEQMANEISNRERAAAERNPDETSMSEADKKLEEAQTKILSDNQLAQLSELKQMNNNLENLVAFSLGLPMPHKLLGVFNAGIDPRDASRFRARQLELDAQTNHLARMVGYNQEDLRLRSAIAREELGKGGEATLKNLSDETLRDLYAYNGKDNQNQYKYNLLYNLSEQADKHKSEILDTDALMKYKVETVRVVTQLTANGYTINPKDYQDIDKLTPAGIYLVLELSKRGAVFKNFKAFGAIKDNNDGWDKAKSIISLYSAKLRNGRIVGNIATANNLTESMISTKGRIKNLLQEANTKDWQTAVDRLFNAEDAKYSEDMLDDMATTSKLDATTRADNYEEVDSNELANSAYREAQINKAGKKLFGTIDKGTRAVLRFGTNNSLGLIKLILDEFAPNIKAGTKLAKMREIAEAAANDPVNKAQHLNEMAQLAAADALVNNPVSDAINKIIEGKLTDTGLEKLGDLGKTVKEKVLAKFGKDTGEQDISREQEAADNWVNSVDQVREGKRLDDILAGNKDKDIINWAIDGASVVRNKDGTVSVVQDDPVNQRIFVWTKDKEKGWLNPVQFSYAQSEEIKNTLQTRRDAVALQIIANMGQKDIFAAKAQEYADYAKEYAARLGKIGLDVTGKAIKTVNNSITEEQDKKEEEKKEPTKEEKVEQDIKETESTPSTKDQTSAERKANMTPLQKIRSQIEEAEAAIKREEAKLANKPKKMKAQDYKRIAETKAKIADLRKTLDKLQGDYSTEEQKEKDVQAQKDKKWLDNPGDLKKQIKSLSKKIKKAKTPEEAEELEKQLQELKATKKRLGINAFGTPFFNESLPFMIPDTNAFGILKTIGQTFFSGAKDKLIDKIDGKDNKQQPPVQQQQDQKVANDLSNAAESMAAAGTAMAQNSIAQAQQDSANTKQTDGVNTIVVNGRIMNVDPKTGEPIIDKNTAGVQKQIDQENAKRNLYYDSMIKMANAVTAAKEVFKVPKLTTLFEGGLLGGIKQLFDLPFQMLSMISPGLAQLVKGGLLGLVSLGGAGFKKLFGKGLKALLTKTGLKDKLGKWATANEGKTVKGAIIRKLGLDRLLEIGDFANTDDGTDIGQSQLEENKKTNSILQRLLDYFTGRKSKEEINKESDQQEAGETPTNTDDSGTSGDSTSTTETSDSNNPTKDDSSTDEKKDKEEDKKDSSKKKDLKDAEVSKDEIYEKDKKNKKGQPIRKKNAPEVYKEGDKYYRVPDKYLDRWKKVKDKKNSEKKRELIKEMHAYNKGYVYDPKTKRSYPQGQEPPKPSTDNNNSITQQTAEDKAKKKEEEKSQDTQDNKDQKKNNNKDNRKTTNKKKGFGRIRNFLGRHKKLTGLGLATGVLGALAIPNSEYGESNVGYLDRLGYGLGILDHYDPNQDKETFAREYEHLMYYYPDAPHVDPSIDNLSLKEQDMLDKMTEQGLSAQQKARALYNSRMYEAQSSTPENWDYYSNMEYAADGAVNNAEYAYNTGSDLASQAYDWATSDGKLMNNTAWLATKGIGGLALNFALTKGLKQKEGLARTLVTGLQTLGDSYQNNQDLLSWDTGIDFIQNLAANTALDKFIFNPMLRAGGRAWRKTKIKSDDRNKREELEHQDDSNLSNEDKVAKDISDTERTPENRPDNKDDVKFERKDGKKDGVFGRTMSKMATTIAHNPKKTIAGLGLLGALGYNLLTPSSSEAAVRNPYMDEPMTAQELYGDEYPTDTYANTNTQDSSGGIVDSALGLLSNPLVGTVAALGAPALTSFLGKKFGSKGELAGDLLSSVLTGDVTDLLDPEIIMDIKDRISNKDNEEDRDKDALEKLRAKEHDYYSGEQGKTDEDRFKEYANNYLDQEREKLRAEKEANKKSIFQRGKDKLSNLKESIKGIPTKVKDSNVLNKVNNSLGGLTDKTTDKATEDALQKQSILGKVKEGIKTVIRAIGKWLPSKGVKSAVSNFGKVILERCKKPEFISKIMKKVARQAAGLAAGAATMGIGLAAVTIAGAVSDFIHGYNSVEEMLELPSGSASTGMKVVAGLVTAICGAIPFLPLPEDLVLQLAIRYVGPAFGFGEKELEDLRRNGNKEDQEEAKAQEQASTFGSEWEKNIKDAATGVVGSVVNTARSASAAIADKAKDLAKTTTSIAKDAVSWVSNTAKGVKDWVFDNASKGYDYLSKKAGQAWETAKDIGRGAWNAAKSGANWLSDKIFGSGKEPLYGMSKFYSQLDPRYAMSYNDSKDTIKQSMYDSGCGPMAAMNAISALNGKGIDPKNAAKFALTKGYKEKNGGTRPEFFKDYMSKAGLTTQSLHSTEKIKDQLKSGNPVILMGKNSNGESDKDPYGRNPHYVTATGIDRKGNIIIQDPESYKPNKIYKASNVLSKSNIAISASKPAIRSAFGRSRFSYTSKYGRGEESTNNGVPQRIWDFLIGKGLGSVTVAAIIGNIGVESAGFQLDALSSDGHESYGLCQWTAGRKENLFNLANSMGKPPSDLDVQLNYLWQELQGSHKHALDATVACGDNLEDATEVFCRKFEVPDMKYAHLDKRIEIARQAFETQGKGVATSGTYTPGSSSSSGSKKNGGLLGAIDNIASIMSAALNPFAKASASPAPTTTTPKDPKAGNTAMMTDYTKDANKPVSVTTDKETGEKTVNVESFDNAIGNGSHISSQQDAMDIAFGNVGTGRSRFINKYGRGLGDIVSSIGAALFPDPKELLKQSSSTTTETKDPADNGIPTGNEEVNPAAAKEDPEKTKEEKEANKEQKDSTTSSSSSGGLFGALESKVKSMVAPLSQAMSKIGSTVLSKINEGPMGQVIKLFFGDNNPFLELFGGGDEEGSNGSNGPLKNINMAIKGSVLETLMNAMPNQGITSSYADTEGRPTPGAHGGIDIAVAEGTDLPSPVSGKVVDVGYEDGGYGNFVQIQDSKGNYHMFAHLSQAIASEGQQVKLGDIIAKTGNTGASTGPHLHYQVDPPDNPGAVKSGNHLNPATYTGAGKNRLGTMFGMGTSIFDNIGIPDNPDHIEDYMTPSIMESPDVDIINNRPTTYGMGSFFGGIVDSIKQWTKKISGWTEKTLGKEIKENKEKESKPTTDTANTTPTQATNAESKIDVLLSEQKKTNDLISKNNELLGQLVQIAAKVIESGINGNKQNTPTMNTNTRLPEYSPETATVKAQLTKFGNGSKYGMGDKFYDKDEQGYSTIINIMNALASR